MRSNNIFFGAVIRRAAPALAALFVSAFASAAEPLPVEEVVVVAKRLEAPAGEVIAAAVKDEADALQAALRSQLEEAMQVSQPTFRGGR